MEKQYDDTVIDSATSLFSDASLAKSQIQASYGRMMEASSFSSETKEAFRNLFKKCDVNFFRPGENLYLRGESPKTNFAVYNGMNGKKIENVPGIIFLDQAVAFANLYNYQLQDRSQKITKNTPINFGKIILPYLIAYICMRNPYSFSENSLSLDTESARITFVAKKFQFSHGNEIPLALSNNILYKILVEEMNLVNQEDFKRAFNCPEFNMGMEIVSSCLCLMYFLPKTYLSSDLDKRIIKYLEVTGGSKRKDIASYFGISDRMMNYYLQSLVASGEIYREGNMTSPYLIYKKTSK